MDIRFTSDKQNRLTVHAAGTLDVSCADSFMARVLDAGFDTAPAVTFDFSDLRYITSAGLRVLMTLKKRAGTKAFRITGLNPDSMQVFRMTGFDVIMDCEEVPADADLTRMSFRDFLAYKTRSGYPGVILQDSVRKLTWADIDRGARNIAADLKQLGVIKGTHVAICSANSVNWLLTFFAIQLLGGNAVLVNYKAEIDSIRAVSDYADVTCFCYGKVLSAPDPADLIAAVTAPGSKIRNVYDMGPDKEFSERRTG